MPIETFVFLINYFLMVVMKYLAKGAQKRKAVLPQSSKGLS